MRWSDSITDSVGMNLSKPKEMAKDTEVWRAAVRGDTKMSQPNKNSEKH